MSLNTFSPTSTQLQPKGLPDLARGSSVIVVGAGAFGGWTALYLLRKGMHVTLVDARGAGNPIGSSGDESRIIRATYGTNEFYFNLCVRAMQLWKENEARWNKKLFIEKGVLWLCYEPNTLLLDESLPLMKKQGMAYEYWTLETLKKKFPMINTNGIHHGFFDVSAGYIRAREASLTVAEAFVKEGGKLIEAQVQPGRIENDRLEKVLLSSGTSAQGDAYVFACGAWLGQLFPEVLGDIITSSKQEVFYFEVPKETAVEYESLPPWVDVDGKDFYYGIPSQHGFKVGVDRRGEKFDPTHGSRIGTPQVLEHARTFLSYRFPGLKNAPLLHGLVCPYENSPDGNFVFDEHPEASNLIFLGGGSGHGFKHGPALGEWVANTLAR